MKTVAIEDTTLHTKLKILCAEQGMTIAEAVTNAIKDYLSKHESK